jgi:uncharacterized membrane protein YeaQ/YmgE (transglycosylase-associated protein family)
MFYLVCYLLIGAAAGLLAGRLMPGRAREGGAALAALGAAGALLFGVGSLLLLGYGRSVAREVWRIDLGGAGFGGTVLPAYRLTFAASAAGALLALACRKLVGTERELP